jgi:hypothetical protein
LYIPEHPPLSDDDGARDEYEEEHEQYEEEGYEHDEPKDEDEKSNDRGHEDTWRRQEVSPPRTTLAHEHTCRRGCKKDVQRSHGQHLQRLATLHPHPVP